MKNKEKNKEENKFMKISRFISQFEKNVFSCFISGSPTSAKPNDENFELEILTLKLPIFKLAYDNIKQYIDSVSGKDNPKEYIESTMSFCIQALFSNIMQFALLSHYSKDDMDNQQRVWISEVLQKTINDLDFLPHDKTTYIEEAKLND